MSSISVEVATSSWLSAVDIIAAVAPAIISPAIQPGTRALASSGMTCSGSARSGRMATPTMPIIGAPQ